MTDGQEKALRQILLNYANDDNSTAWETISAILSVVGCDGEMPTLRDQFAMAAMIADSMQSAIIAVSYLAQGKNFSGDFADLGTDAEEYFKTADSMMEARKK